MEKKKRKAKPMTVREKKDRARCRKELRAEGVLPPKKRPLNRKAFCNRARSELEKHDGYDFILYLYWALSEMLEKQDFSRPGAVCYSLEAVGAAKVVLLAAKRMEFEKEKAGQPFTRGELFEAVEEIYNA